MHCKGTAVPSDPDMILHCAAGTNSKRSLQGRLATTQDLLYDHSRDIEASHISPTCTGNKTQAQSASLTKLVASGAGQPETYRTPHVKPAEPDGRHLASNGYGSNPMQLSQDTMFYTSQAIQGSGVLFVLQCTSKSSRIPVQAVSENSKGFIGRTPSELLSLESFTSIIKETQVDEFVEQIEVVQSEQTDFHRFKAFMVSMSTSEGHLRDFWCLMHQTDTHSSLIICEFELHEDECILGCQGHSVLRSPSYMMTGTAPPKKSAKTRQSQERPLRDRCSAEKRLCNSVAMDILNKLSRVQDRLATAPDVESLLEVAVDTAKELTGFHRVMIYQFDQDFNARVVAEHADTEATTGAYKGRTFAASEFTRDFRESHRRNKIRMLYDRDIGTARLVCSAPKAFQLPINLTYSSLRAMSHDHLKSLANLAVRSSISISIGAFDRLWGLIVCHSYGLHGMRVSFPIRRICSVLSDVVSENIERFSYVS